MKEIDILCEQQNLPLNTAKDLYVKNDGNLFPIIMLSVAPIKNSVQPLIDIFDSLDNDQRLFMYIIELEQGEITYETLQEIFSAGSNILAGNEKYSKAYIKLQCEELQQKNLILISDDIIKLSQDQLFEIISSYCHSPIYYLAWDLLENYHQQLLAKLHGNKKEIHILALLHIYSVIPDKKICCILPELTEIILRYPPKKMIEKIDIIRKQLELHSDNHRFINFLIQYLADICIAVGQWDVALCQVKDTYSEDVPWQACYLAATMAANPQLPNVEEILLRIREKHKHNIHIYMSITVSLLSYYMRTVPEINVATICQNFIKELSAYQNLNYAFLLKMYSNTQCNEAAISTLEKANIIFNSYNRYDLVVMNMITIASRNVYMGQTEIGLDILKKIEKAILEQNIPIRCHYLLNNISAIKLIKSEYTEQIQQDLTAAFFSTSSQFEKTIIICNLMIYFICTSQLSKAKKTFHYLESLELSQYNNVDLKFILLKNTLYYYEAIQDQKNISLYQKRLISFAFSDDCPEDIRTHILSLFPDIYPQYASIPKSFLANFPFEAEFIGYWQFEVCYDGRGQNRLKSLANHLAITNS